MVLSGRKIFAISLFPSFKLPQLLRKSSPESEICGDVPRFKCSELPVKQRIGQGSFGDVYTSEYKGSEDTKCQTVVITKMFTNVYKCIKFRICLSIDQCFLFIPIYYGNVTLFVLSNCHATLLTLTLTGCRSARFKQDVLKRFGANTLWKNCLLSWG